MIINPELMCCCRCGHIAKEGDAYDTELGEEEDFPICPKCGKSNVGGYSSFAPIGIWQEDDFREIIEMNEEFTL